MKKKLFIKALIVGVLLTLFSCSNRIMIEKGAEDIRSPTIPTVSGYKQRVISMPYGTLYEIITPKDTFLVFGKYQTGTVLLKHSPVK